MKIEIKPNGICIVETDATAATFELCDIKDIQYFSGQNKDTGERQYCLVITKKSGSRNVEVATNNIQDIPLIYGVVSEIKKLLSKENEVFYAWLQQNPVLKPYCVEEVNINLKEEKPTETEKKDV